MGNRSRHRSRHDRAAKPPLPFAHIARTQCDNCGSPVEWITPAEAQSRGIDLAPALTFLGVDSTNEIWACTHCDNYGAMGPTQFTDF